MTVRKGIPRLGKHRKEPDFGTKCPEAAGSVPTPEHAAEMGQEAFSGRTAKAKNGGTHDRKSIQTLAAAGTQTGRFPLPHDPGAEETGNCPHSPGMLQL